MEVHFCFNSKKQQPKKAYIDIELSHEARKIAVLEVLRKQPHRELSHIPNDKTIISITPRDYRVRSLIIHHLITFSQKRRHRPKRSRPIIGNPTRIHHTCQISFLNNPKLEPRNSIPTSKTPKKNRKTKRQEQEQDQDQKGINS